jgi:hypothetical protein
MSFVLACGDGEVQLPDGAVQQSSLALQLLRDCRSTGLHVFHVRFEVAAVHAWARHADPGAFTLQQLLEVRRCAVVPTMTKVCRVAPRCAERSRQGRAVDGVLWKGCCTQLRLSRSSAPALVMQTTPALDQPGASAVLTLRLYDVSQLAVARYCTTHEVLLTCVTLQVALFMHGDARRWATHFCAALTAGHPNAERAWQLLAGATEHLHDTVIKSHPVFRAGLPLCATLERLPPCLHAAACQRACFRTETSDRGLTLRIEDLNTLERGADALCTVQTPRVAQLLSTCVAQVLAVRPCAVH